MVGHRRRESAAERAQRIARVKQQVADGTYTIDHDQLADALLDEIVGPERETGEDSEEPAS